MLSFVYQLKEEAERQIIYDRQHCAPTAQIYLPSLAETILIVATWICPFCSFSLEHSNKLFLSDKRYLLFQTKLKCSFQCENFYDFRK